MSLPLVQMMHPPHLILHVLPRSWEGRGSGQFLWNVFSKFCTGLWARNAAIETDWHVVKPGHSARLVDGEGAVFFRVCWIFSPPLILAPLNHSLCRSIPWFPSLCCRLNFCFFHSCFQMVEGSCLQTACRRNLQQLGTFSRWILTLQFSVSRPWTPTLKWTARQLYLTEVWETTINLNKAWSERANSHDEWRLITHYFRSLGRRPWELLTTLQPHCVCAKCLIDPVTAAILHCKVASSSSTCSVSTQTIASKVKHVPPLFSDLFDLAIYSFGCQSSLHSHHKVRGNPVLEGVSVILDRMVLTSNPETKAAFEEITPTRLGNWLFLHLLYLAPVYMEVGDPR